MKFSVQIILMNIFIHSSVGDIAVFAPCYTNEDCEEYKSGFCVDGICVCNGTRFCEEKHLIHVTKVGLSCKVNEECMIHNAECKIDKCACLPKYVAAPNGKTCLSVASGIGGECQESVQCYTKTAHSGCQNNKCVCQQHMHEHNGSCYKSVGIDEQCSADAECIAVQFTECKGSVCACKEHHVKSTEGSRCLPVAKGEKSPCTDDNQCVATLGKASECFDGFCRCKEFHQLKNSTNKCVRDMLLGDICMKHSDCNIPYPGNRRLECILGVCKCLSWYREVDGFCISSSKTVGASLILLILCKYLTVIF